MEDDLPVSPLLEFDASGRIRGIRQVSNPHKLTRAFPPAA